MSSDGSPILPLLVMWWVTRGSGAVCGEVGEKVCDRKQQNLLWVVKGGGVGIIRGSPSREIGAARLPSMMSGQVGRGDDGKQLSDSMGNQASLASLTIT